MLWDVSVGSLDMVLVVGVMRIMPGNVGMELTGGVDAS